MQWLLLLAVLATAGDIPRDGRSSGSSLNRLAETSLNRRVGGAQRVRVLMQPTGQWSRGDFQSFRVELDGFNADRLLNLADTSSATPDYTNRNTTDRNTRRFDLGDVLNSGVLGPDILGGDLGDVLGDILGGNRSSTAGVGRIRNLEIQATNFSFGGVRYEGLSASIGELRFDWSKALRGEFDIQSLSPGSLQLRLSAAQAARLLSPRLPDIRDLRLRFQNGKTLVSGRADAYGVRMPFEIGGRLSVQQNQVRADDLQLSVASVRLPRFVVEEITRSLNPLYDFDLQSRWPVVVNLSTATANNDFLAMRGQLQWHGFNRDRQDQRSHGDRGDYDDGRQDRYPDEAWLR